MILGPDGAVVVGVFASRRIRWAEVAEVELARRTVRSSAAGRWRVVLRMRDHATVWVPGFLHGSVLGGLDRSLGEIKILDRSRYPVGHTEAPPEAPADLARLHRELRTAWLRAGGTPVAHEARVREMGGRRRERRAAVEKHSAELADRVARIESRARDLGIALPEPPPAAAGLDGATAQERIDALRRHLDAVRRRIEEHANGRPI
ncbi:PH domain-containing protein [Embleya sp. NPDC050154]|uniref:PH domain-containing protein n=1 Tax=Embleya sp. NPDC050154 TaxID=3363988 RepID=UPI0037995527